MKEIKGEEKRKDSERDSGTKRAKDREEVVRTLERLNTGKITDK